MKRFLLAMSVLAGLQADAQRTENAIEQSVFIGYKDMKPVSLASLNTTRQSVSTKFAGWNASIDKLSGLFTDVYGKAIAIPGNTVIEKSLNCMDNQLKGLGVNKSDWQQVSNVTAPHAAFVDYVQYIAGHKVVFSNLSFRYTTDARLLRIQMKNYGQPEAGLVPVIDKQTTLNSNAIAASIAGTIDTKEISNDWVWFPIPTTAGYVMHPAWAFTASGKANNNMPLDLYGYIDAITGDLLYRTNNVREAYSLTVKGDSIYKDGSVPPPSVQPLADLVITIGTKTDTTDANGFASFPTLTGTQSPVIKLSGIWSTVHTGGSTGTTPSFTPSVANAGTYVFPTTSPSSYRHLNAYYNVNIVHDYMKTQFPTSTGFTKMDFSLPTNVDVTSGSCNAFYANKVINFYAAGNGCNSFTTINDVIYHEYGHGISDQFYNWKGKGTITNGALNEANSDIWAISITHIPVIGRYNTIGDTNSFIRRYDETPKVFPMDIVGESHADGEIIAGAWWDVAVNIGSVDTMGMLFSKTYYDTPDGPTGTEGSIYHAVLISAILNDDDDNNLSNGTPHLAAIAGAFARHGIYLMSDAVITHQELGNQPAGSPINITATLTLTQPEFFQDLKLFYREQIKNQWDSVTLTNTGNYTFTGQLPAASTSDVFEYYFAVYDVLNNSTFGFPNGYNTQLAANQVTIPYQFTVGMSPKYKMDFETDATGWTLGNISGDNAKSGKWIQAVPVASSYNSLPVQTGNDHTTGSGSCLVTGNGASATASYNSADVDSGKTTAVTPMFDMAQYVYPVVEYYRWYANDRGSNARNDQWQVQIRDTTNPFWINVDMTYQSDYNWRKRDFPVRKYLPSARYVQMRFIATDALDATLQNRGQGNVEAEVDDFAILDVADLSVGDISTANVSIYPNPADGVVYISASSEFKGTVSITDMMGRKILTEELAGKKMSINTAQLSAGQYLLMIQSASSVTTKKLVITH